MHRSEALSSLPISMIRIERQSFVKSVNKCFLYQSELVVDHDQRDINWEIALPPLLKQIDEALNVPESDNSKACVVLTFKEPLSDELYLSISKIIQRFSQGYDYKFILSKHSYGHKECSGRGSNGAQLLNLNFFKSERGMAKMIKNYMSHIKKKPSVDQDKLIKLLLKLLELNGLDFSEEQVIGIAYHYKSLKEIANVIKAENSHSPEQ